MIVVDSSALIAAMNTKDPDHAACAAVLDDVSMGPFILSPLVLAEVDYMITTRAGVDVELSFLSDVTIGRYELVTLDAGDVGECMSVVSQYRDLDIGVTDASLVVLAARHGTASLLTLDERHFRAVKPLDGSGVFTLLPMDK